MKNGILENQKHLKENEILGNILGKGGLITS